MKIGFIVPVLENVDIEKYYDNISKSCKEAKVNFDVIFCLSSNLNETFSKIREKYIDKDNVRAFKINLPANQHELITVAMKYCEDYDATFIYSARNEYNSGLVKTMINSWKAGNKIVYAKLKYKGFKKILMAINRFFYKCGLKMLKVFMDNGAETDIQLFDQDVVKTINQLPGKNRTLRVLDSFVGYNTDIVEFNYNNKPSNKLYSFKSQNFYTSLIMSLVALGVGAICLTLGILSLAFEWHVGILVNLVFWLLFICGIVVSYLYYTRTVLSYRVGEQLENADVKALFDRTEKYNLK